MGEVKTKKRCSSYPTGDFPTGCCDVMIGKDKSGVLIRLFYPSSVSSIKDHKSQWTKWHLGTKYSQGLGIFFMPYIFPAYQIVSDMITMNSVIPSVWEAPVADGKFPLVIFSHGLATHRSLYSSVCNELASHGFIVAAIEHRDRSASATFTLNEKGQKKWVMIKPVLSRKYEFDVRYKQIKIRAAECSQALDVLERISRGETLQNELPSSISLSAFEGKIDTSNAVLAGHSFGGGATLLTLGKDKRFKCGICLDPWMYPLEAFYRSRNEPSEAEVAEMKSLSEKIDQPILFILMECFQDEKNLEAMKKYEKPQNSFWTLLKAVHQNQTDTSMLFKNSNAFLKHLVGCSSVIHPDIAMKLNNYLMVNFICKNLNIYKKCTEEYADYIFKNEKWAFDGATGTAKFMPGWHKKMVRK